jgi:hypothetical protein
VDFKDGVLTFVCHFDFTTYIGQSLKTDPLKAKLLPILDNLVQWTWQKELKNVKSNLDWFGPRIKVVFPDAEWKLDIEGTRMIPGHLKDGNGNPLAINKQVLTYLHSYVCYQFFYLFLITFSSF